MSFWEWKKYEQCCLRKNNASEYELMRTVVKYAGYNDRVGDVVCNLYRYMKQKNWIGACHATCSVLYIALSELGYAPRICIGEVAVPTFRFDHSWIEIDGKIIDLAVAMTLMSGRALSAPIILDIDEFTGEKYNLLYGIKGSGLDTEALLVMNTSFGEYMDMFPDEKNGLWDVLNIVYPGNINLEVIRGKYKEVKRDYIVKKL